MKAGRESRTAVMVCAARAAAQGRTTVAEFDDPTAMALLPEDAREKVGRLRAAGRDGKAGIREAAAATRREMAVVRTVAIDRAVRETAAPQLVILGAGLDGRAWRMKELAGTTVFEVDHPDSQAAKRARTAALTPTAREIRFVAVDFTRDSLEEKLAKAGHDPELPTIWIWEGVVMYLSRAAIEATLAVVGRRSAAGSRLAVLYNAPAPLLTLAGWFLRFLGEPLRSAFDAAQMKALLAAHGFAVTRDGSLPEIAAGLSAETAHAVRALRHLRIAVADRTDGAERPA